MEISGRPNADNTHIGPIEKGANDGQIEYVKALTAALRAAVTSKAPVKGPIKKGKRKGKKDALDEATLVPVPIIEQQKPANWGLFEPLRMILEPIMSLVGPFITSQTVIAVLFVLLMYTWVVPPRQTTSIGLSGYASPERFAAYEELWRMEESNLWDWLEDRVGLDHLYAPPLSKEQQNRQRSLKAKNMKKRLDGERMSERQMDDAIKITQERLAALKDAVAGKKAKKKGSEAV